MNYMEEQAFLDDLYAEAIGAVEGNTRQAALYVQAELDRIGVDDPDIAARRADFEIAGLTSAISKFRQRHKIVTSDGVAIQRFQSVPDRETGQFRYTNIELFDADELLQLGRHYLADAETKSARGDFLILAATYMKKHDLTTAGEAFVALGAELETGEAAA